MKNLTVSEHFQFEAIGDGVYAAFAKSTGKAVSNAGVIDLGDRVVIFDSFLAPTAALDLAKASEAATGKPVRFVVNSHHHLDHVEGNAALKAKFGVSIIGPKAEAAVPALLKLGNDKDYLIRLYARAALKVISPSTATRFENST